MQELVWGSILNRNIDHERADKVIRISDREKVVTFCVQLARDWCCQSFLAPLAEQKKNLLKAKVKWEEFIFHNWKELLHSSIYKLATNLELHHPRFWVAWKYDEVSSEKEEFSSPWLNSGEEGLIITFAQGRIDA